MLDSVWNRLKDLVSQRPQRTPIPAQNPVTGEWPVPPAHLISLVAGTQDTAWFLQSGAQGLAAIREILGKNGVAMEQLHAVLDFGCGVGRVTRHWPLSPGVALYGSDYNPKLIEWCQANLPFAQFQVNKLSGKLKYPNETFDFIYALSVFTHLTESTQFFWIKELARVLRPGGYLFISLHGEYYFPTLSAEGQELFRRGELIVVKERREGSNECATYHPERYVRERLAKDFTVVDFVPQGAKGNPYQDAYLLKKPSGP